VTLPDLLADLAAGDSAVVVAIVAARLLVPLLVPRAPLVIVVALVLDAADQTLLQSLTEIDTSETGPYQSWDKALDVYYLAIAYLAMLRNWTSDAAVRIGQALFFYRLLGVALFELLDERALLLVFPNTFEYYFIAYELWRLRREPARLAARVWLLVALVLWVVVKLPQEYWIHVAQLDVTDAVRDHPWLGVIAAATVLALLAFTVLVLVPRLPPPDWRLELAAAPIPASIDEAHERRAHRLRRRRVVWSELIEVGPGLLGLILTIFAAILPGVDATPAQIAVGVTLGVLANTAIARVVAGRGGLGVDSAVVVFPLVFGLNLGLVFAGWLLLARDDAEFDLGPALFFAFLISVILWLYDRYKPVHDVRFEGSPLRITSPGDLVRRVREDVP
jgi:hypothetical protein